jgi:hypothetical protein
MDPGSAYVDHLNRSANLRNRELRFHLLLAWSAALGLFAPPATHANTSLHTTWLWHLHQPIYWPDRRDYGTDHYEAAWDTIQQQDALRPHPSPEVLRNIFGLDDRVNAYQGRASIPGCHALHHRPVNGFSPWQSTIPGVSYLCPSVVALHCYGLLLYSNSL